MTECIHLLRTQEYLDGELQSEAARVAAAHIEECDICADWSQQSVRVDALLTAADPALHPKVSLTSDRVATVSRASGQRSFPGRWAVAAALVLTATLMFFLNTSPPPPGADEFHELLGQYSAATGDDRVRLQKQILAWGPDVSPMLVQYLNAGDDLGRQNAAVQLLGHVNDRQTAQLIWDYGQQHDLIGGNDFVLGEFGEEEQDIEALFTILEDPEANIYGQNGETFALFSLESLDPDETELSGIEVRALAQVGFKIPPDGTSMRGTVRNEITSRLASTHPESAFQAIQALNDIYYYQPLLDLLGTNPGLSGRARELLNERADRSFANDREIRIWYDLQLNSE